MKTNRMDFTIGSSPERASFTIEHRTIRRDGADQWCYELMGAGGGHCGLFADARRAFEEARELDPDAVVRFINVPTWVIDEIRKREREG